LATKTWSSTAPPEEFRPYIDSEQGIPEFTLRAVLAGIVAGLFFGAVTVYVGLRAGLTVSASIPIAVLSISILRAFGKVTILENNIVQTTGSAGESIAGGVIFTLPALIFLGFPLEYLRVFFLALMILLWLLILRCIAIESRSHNDTPLWREFWDTTFSFSSVFSSTRPLWLRPAAGIPVLASSATI
jgi:hypothetical protein